MTTTTTAPAVPVTSALVCRDQHAIGDSGFSTSPHLHAVSTRALANLQSVERVVPAINPSGPDQVSVDLYAEPACGQHHVVQLAYGWGFFDRHNENLGGDGVCPVCAWHVALTSGLPHYELDYLTPSEPDQRVLALHLPDPLTARHLAEAVLTATSDSDHRDRIHQLGDITHHSPIVLREEECVGGVCQHPATDNGPNCPPEEAVIACPHCGILADPDYPEITDDELIAGPCATFTALMDRYAPTQLGEVRR